MKVLALHPLEYPVSKLSIDTKFMQNGLSSKGVLTSEPVYYSNVCMDAYSPTTTLADQTPPPYYIQAIDINKHRIMHLQRYKHVLRLVVDAQRRSQAALQDATLLSLV
ncbi:hypothetical protein GGI26_000245 [Coemansia sp. RSA 1358]|nr:hypothetical protein GGI26_000245 [Coemansia sp. RSA 1358]